MDGNQMWRGFKCRGESNVERNQMRRGGGGLFMWCRPRAINVNHPGGEPGANLKSISHRCHPILVVFTSICPWIASRVVLGGIEACGSRVHPAAGPALIAVHVPTDLVYQHQGKWHLPKVETSLEYHLNQVVFLGASTFGRYQLP